MQGRVLDRMDQELHCGALEPGQPCRVKSEPSVFNAKQNLSACGAIEASAARLVFVPYEHRANHRDPRLGKLDWVRDHQLCSPHNIIAHN